MIVSSNCPAVSFDRVAKTYRRGRGCATALRELTLSVEPCRIAALIGPNGSGKTTALRIAATLVSPTSGTCRVFGLDVGSSGRHVRGTIGVSFGSERSFYWRLTALQNLTFFSGLVGIGRTLARRKIARLAAELDIERFLMKPVRQLSRGALARLSVARACLVEPPLLLLDEPFVSVDKRGRELLWKALRRRAEDGQAVLLTTHDPSLVPRCDVLFRLEQDPP